MLRFPLIRSRVTPIAAAVLAASALAGCGTDGSFSGASSQCTVDLPVATTNAQLHSLVQALQASGDPCGHSPLPGNAMGANTVDGGVARSSKLVAIDRGDTSNPNLRLVFAVRASTE